MKIKISSLVLLLVFVFSSIFAASRGYAKELKLAYVDAVRIFDNYDKTKEQDKILEKAADEKKQEREKIVKDIRKMKDELDLLSEGAKEKKEAQIDEKIAGLQEYDREIRLNLSQKKDRVVREILKEINDVVEKYAKDNGYTMILNNRLLVYSQEEDDLTNEILKILNSKYKK